MGDVEQAKHVIELMVLTAWADGHVEGTEALAIHKMIATIPALKDAGLSGDISKSTRQRMQQIGLEKCLEESTSGIHDPLYKELAFQCCARVMGADGDFAVAEAKVLGDLQAVFGLSPADVRRLLVLATR